MNELDALRRALERERLGRREAERLLEARSLALFADNEQLRRQASACAAEVERREAALFHHSPIASFEADLSGLDGFDDTRSEAEWNKALAGVRILNVNRATIDLTGCRNIDAFEAAVRRFAPSWRGDAARLVAALRSGNLTFSTQRLTLGAQGRRLQLLVHARALAAQSLSRVVFTLVDVTARAVAERDARRARAVAERASAYKSEFLASSSHEIRTPLNAVLGLAQVLEVAPDLNDERREQAGLIRLSADALMAVLNDILDLGRIEAGRLDLAPEPVDLKVLARTLDATWSAVARKNNVQLDIDVDAPAGDWPMIDVGRTRQILNNLISNALKFTAGGAVRVSLKLTAASTHEGRLALIVADNGCGMTPEALQRIWRPFEQGAFSTWRQHGGSGLGLSIVRKLAERMNGRTHAESEEGRGSTFTIELPCPLVSAPKPIDVAPEPAPEPAPEIALAPARAPASADVRTTAPRILAAEDNLLAQRVLVAMLDALGFSADVVSNGREAIEAMKTGDYDVVLMDILMPLMNGVEATTAIRALGGRASETPIIAVTADAMMDQRSVYLNAGMDDVIPKPINGAVLARTLWSWTTPEQLARRRAAAGSALSA